MDKAHTDNVPRRRPRSTGPSRSAAPGARTGRSGSTRVSGRVAAAAAEAAPEVSGIVTQAPAGARASTRRGRMAGSRPLANRPASAPPNTAGRRVGRIAAAARSGQPATPMARSRVALNVAVLGLVFLAVAFVLAVPLRNYFSQRNQLDAAVATEQAMTAQKLLLQQQKAALTDPFYLSNQARQRLQFVAPGDTVYVVHAPALPKAAEPAAQKPVAQAPWYSDLWNTLADPAAPAGSVAAPVQPAGRAGG
jgi:cell division protein FtsB